MRFRQITFLQYHIRTKFRGMKNLQMAQIQFYLQGSPVITNFVDFACVFCQMIVCHCGKGITYKLSVVTSDVSKYLT